MRKKTNCVIKFVGLKICLFLYFKNIFKIKILYFKLFFIFFDIKNILKYYLKYLKI